MCTKLVIAMIEDRRTGEFMILKTAIDKDYKLKDAKRDFSQIGTIHKIIVRE